MYVSHGRVVGDIDIDVDSAEGIHDSSRTGVHEDGHDVGGIVRVIADDSEEEEEKKKKNQKNQN